MSITRCPYAESCCCACAETLGGRFGDAPDVERIAQEVLRRLRAQMGQSDGRPAVVVGVSVRHIHLDQATLDRLYGEGHALTPLRDLHQPGQCAAVETATVVGPRLRSIEGVRILGPLRDYSQVELSRTDGIHLGLALPVRDAGDLDGVPPITLVGPAGSVTLPHGAIRANRHIHISPAEVEAMGLQGREKVRVRVPGEKGLTFDNVYLRISPDYRAQIHLDTDDANAADLSCGDYVIIET